MVPVEEAEEDESLTGDSRGSFDTSSSSSALSSKIGGASGGSLVRCDFANER